MVEEDTMADEPPTVPAQGLFWSIKSSFLAYVGRMPDGRGSISGGATPTPGDGFCFSPDPVPRECPAGADEVLAFTGDVRFSGHAGLLFVRVADPRVILRGHRAELTIAHPYQLESAERRTLVTFDVVSRVEDGVQALVGEQVRLVDDAVDLFDEVYPPGELFDPLIIARPAGRRPDLVDRLAPKE